MIQPQLPQGTGSALNKDLSAVDEVASMALQSLEVDRVFARGIAMEQVAGFELCAAAATAVGVARGAASDGLVVAAIGRSQAKCPVTPWQGIVQGVALVSARARVTTLCIIALANVEQVVQAQRVVPGQGGTGLVASGGPGATVVQVQTQSQREA